MGRWVKAADISDFDNLHPDQPSLPVDVEGYDLVLFKLHGGWAALEDTCSHEFSKLSEGEVWDDRVYCEKHGSSFDCRTGEVRGLPATDDVPAYSVERRGDEIWVELPDYA
ncbi:MAG: Rieske 2Fe-2S domain-containing protein [Spirochaetaceae bacterium]|nr:Rieske 2Fe-2S domain-containing protein [Spirochaetaceae bacterium]MDT8298266.1 Rieske 2Fe-2S domain-containing protein [Spirochaetaceae bacterium]